MKNYNRKIYPNFIRLNMRSESNRDGTEYVPIKNILMY